MLTYSVICVQPTSAATNAEKQARLTQKVKEGISSLGVGKDALVKVKLRNNTKLAGYISQAGEDSFAVADPTTGKESVAAYADVTQVKGHNRSTGAKVAIGVAIAVAIALFIGFIWAETNGY